MKLDNHTDERGTIVWASNKILNFNYKYLTIGTIEPGTIRAGYYHKRIFKKFLCIYGKIKLSIGNKGITLESGEIVDIPTGKVHIIKNIGDKTAFFVEFKSEDYDTNDRHI